MGTMVVQAGRVWVHTCVHTYIMVPGLLPRPMCVYPWRGGGLHMRGGAHGGTCMLTYPWWYTRGGTPMPATHAHRHTPMCMVVCVWCTHGTWVRTHGGGRNECACV